MVSSDSEGVPTLVKSRIRAYLLSCTDHKESLQTFPVNYGKMYKAFKPNEFGFSNLLQLMQSIPDAVQISNQHGQVMLTGLPLQANKHIVNMIDKQKKPKKPKSKIRRDVGIFPRYQQAGYRTFRSNPIPRNAVFHQSHSTKPAPVPKPSSFASKPPPLMLPPSNTKTASRSNSNSYNSQKPNYPTNTTTNRVSALDRLGPPINQTSASATRAMNHQTPFRNLSNGQSVAPASRSSTNSDSRFYQIPQRASNRESRENLCPVKNLQFNALQSEQADRVSVFDRLGPRTASSATASSRYPWQVSGDCEATPVRQYPPDSRPSDPRRMTASVKEVENTNMNRKPAESSRPSIPATPPTQKPSQSSPPVPQTNTTEVIYVDLKNPSEASVEDNPDFSDQVFSYEDSDFLKRLVRHLLAALDRPEDRIFTAAGITSRMRRQLVRNGIDIPSYMLQIIHGFLTSSWEDCFVKSSDGLTEETTEFTFTDEIRQAYRQPVRTLAEQSSFSLNVMHTVKITHVASPAFYIRTSSEESVNKFAEMTQKLKDFIEGDEPEDIFTYRTNELCAVYIQASDRFMRGRLQTFRIKVIQLDTSNIQLSLVAVVFLVDTGEQVTIPAGDVYALPNCFYRIPAFAYRCIFSGARVIDQERFTSVMKNHVEKEVELSVAVQQNSTDGLVLQVRVFASSYLIDDLVFNNIATKVTIGEPDPKSFPRNKNKDVRFVDWHQGYRSILVQRWSDKELEELAKLEKELGRIVAVKNTNGVRRALENNFYVWLQSNGNGRRVVCRSSTDKGLVVQCLDHGCRCKVTDLGQLFFPADEKLITAFSQHPFMATSIPLAMIPDFCGEADVLSNRNSRVLKHQLRNLCPTHTILTVRHDTSISETQAFMLWSDNDESKSSINIQYLNLFMDMRNWAENQRFTAYLSPLDSESGQPSEDQWQRYIVRFDKEGCSPNFAVPVREYRFMEQCSMEFTSEQSGGSVMTNLSDLPVSEIIDVHTKLILSLPDESRAVRVTVTEPYLASSSGQVNIRLVDNPIDCVFSVESHQLFTFSKTVSQQVKVSGADFDASEMKHFRDLLQNLPPLDQIVLSSTSIDCDSQTPVSLEIVSFETSQRFPHVALVS